MSQWDIEAEFYGDGQTFGMLAHEQDRMRFEDERDAIEALIRDLDAVITQSTATDWAKNWALLDLQRRLEP